MASQSITLIIKPTDACNIRCKHCYHAQVGYNNNLLPIEKVFRLMDLAAQKYKYISIMFHGGEPLCAPIEYYIKILDYSRLNQFNHVRFRWLLQTNAININENWCRFLKKNHFSVGVSFDGPVNNVLRQKTTEALAGIKLLQQHNVPVSAIATLSSMTISNMIDIYEFFKSENLDFKFGYVFKSGAAAENDFLCVDESTKLKYLIDFYKYWAKDVSCEIDCGDAVQITNLLLNQPIRLCVYQSCLSQWICLSPNGNLYPCGRNWGDEYLLGNIDSVIDFDDIWDSAAFHLLLKETIIRRESCKHCKFFAICKSGCNSDCLLRGGVRNKDNFQCLYFNRCVDELKPFIESISTMEQRRNINPQLIKMFSQ